MAVQEEQRGDVVDSVLRDNLKPFGAVDVYFLDDTAGDIGLAKSLFFATGDAVLLGEQYQLGPAAPGG